MNTNKNDSVVQQMNNYESVVDRSINVSDVYTNKDKNGHSNKNRSHSGILATRLQSRMRKRDNNTSTGNGTSNDENFFDPNHKS